MYQALGSFIISFNIKSQRMMKKLTTMLLNREDIPETINNK